MEVEAGLVDLGDLGDMGPVGIDLGEGSPDTPERQLRPSIAANTIAACMPFGPH